MEIIKKLKQIIKDEDNRKLVLIYLVTIPIIGILANYVNGFILFAMLMLLILSIIWTILGD